MTWIEYHEKQFSSNNAINLDHVECIRLKDYVVLLRTDKVQYELYYADNATAQEAYDEILAAILKGHTAETIIAPEQAWKRAMES